jgi:hypothetical protein
MNCFNNHTFQQNSGDAIFYKKCKKLFRVQKPMMAEIKNMTNGRYLKYKYGKSLCDENEEAVKDPNTSTKKSPSSACQKSSAEFNNPKTIKKICLQYKFSDF